MRIGIVEPQRADRFRLPSPRLLHAVGDLVGAGLPARSVAEIRAQLLDTLDATASRLVGVLAVTVLEGRDDRWMPSATEIPELAALLGRVRPATGTAVTAALGQALEQQAEVALAGYVARISSGVHPGPTTP